MRLQRFASPKRLLCAGILILLMSITIELLKLNTELKYGNLARAPNWKPPTPTMIDATILRFPVFVLVLSGLALLIAGLELLQRSDRGRLKWLTVYTVMGPAIGTFAFCFGYWFWTGYQHGFIWNPEKFLRVLFLALPFGYVLSLVPAFLTGLWISSRRTDRWYHAVAKASIVTSIWGLVLLSGLPRRDTIVTSYLELFLLPAIVASLGCWWIVWQWIRCSDSSVHPVTPS
jgi:heme/copper-type cytochrome/quinol oxidase subunit 3